MRPIAASGIVPAPPTTVFAFLAELENHWLVADRWIHVVRLDGDGDGGRVRIDGPLGLRRTAHTRVLRADPPRALEGRATLGGTVARVRWELREQHGGATFVRLEAELERATPLDRLLLAAGGRAWLQRRFGATVVALARRFAGASRSAEPRPPAPPEAWRARA
jgi:uncharacterized protein YndB with AHSA1/START domain